MESPGLAAGVYRQHGAMATIAYRIIARPPAAQSAKQHAFSRGCYEAFGSRSNSFSRKPSTHRCGYSITPGASAPASSSGWLERRHERLEGVASNRPRACNTGHDAAAQAESPRKTR